FSPDASELAVGREDGSITLLDANTGAQLPALPGPRGAIADLAFTPDGKQLVVATKAGAQLRDVAPGKLAAILDDAPTREARMVAPGRFALTTARSVVLVGVDGK